jgi:hypothetical protein
VAGLGICAASPFEHRGGRRELAILTLCGGLKALSLVLPEERIEPYSRTEPWKRAPAPVVLEAGK